MLKLILMIAMTTLPIQIKQPDQTVFVVNLPRGQDVAVQDVLLEVYYELDGTADLYLNEKQLAVLKGKSDNYIRYGFSSRRAGWKLGDNTLEFRLSKDSKFRLRQGSVTYHSN